MQLNNYMEIDPKPTEKEPQDESKVFGISIRGFITLLVVFTVCAMSATQLEIKEPLYTLAGLTIGYYFGHSVRGLK